MMIMTNEEKAQELAIKYCKEIDPHGREVYNIGCGIACCEMAEWKEQQMIEKACEFIAEWFYEHPHSQMVCSDEFETIDKLLNRLKKAMEE